LMKRAILQKVSVILLLKSFFAFCTGANVMKIPQ
jgi:hypothetical protein